MRTQSLLVPLAGALLLGPPARADEHPVQPIQEIRQAVERFLLERDGDREPPAQVRVGRVDPRLKMPRCREPLAPFVNPGARMLGNVTVGVRCDGDRPWTLYVSASVKLMRPVLVLTRPVARDQILHRADLRLEERDLGALTSGFLTDPETVLGLRAKRPLRAGAVLDRGYLALPVLVRRGETVTLLAQSAGFEVRTEGEALADGASGALVTVRNLRSRRVVEGVVAAPGVVRIRM